MQFDPVRKQKLVDTAKDVLLKNRRTSGNYQYTVPSPEAYPYQWLWDSCFHAIVFSHYDIAAAKAEIRSVISRQFENGMIPHMIYWEEAGAIKINWGREGTSSITQPPLLAETILAIYEKDQDVTFLKETYSSLYHFYNYLLSERDPRRHHLAGIINPDESGEDNSPRFDAALGLPPKQTIDENFAKRIALVGDLASCSFDAPFCMKNFFWVKDVPFNAILARSLRALAQISEIAGFPEERLLFAQEALAIEQAMRERMLENGLYYATDGENYEKIVIKTWAIFAPLYAHLLSSEEAQQLVAEHFHNEVEFQAPYALPTVAMDEASYDPESMWRGPVWMASNWFVFRGLLEYGFTKEAQLLLEKSAALLELSGFREHFHPQTGEGQGAKDFTWGALIIDMFARGEQADAVAQRAGEPSASIDEPGTVPAA